MTKRVLTGIALLLLLGFAVYMGDWVFSILFMVAICMCIFEVFRAMKNAGKHPAEWPVWACVCVSIPVFLWTDQSYTVLLLMGAACVLTVVQVLFRHEPDLTDLMFSCLPLFSVLLPGMCMLSFQQLPGKLMRSFFILLSFGVPLMGDTFALFVGRRFGKHPFCPAVSPKKTVEGAVGGFFGSLFFAALMYVIYMNFMETPPLWHILLLGAAAGLLGEVGDLFASLEKRYCGIKDFAHIFPGHGGMMDRLDSVFFGTLAVYLYSLIYMAGRAA